MKAVVVFDGVSKKFRRGERLDSFRDLVPAMVRGVFSRRRPEDLDEREFWALRDLSFEVKPGEALGIIGPNGAGKSTALKLLTRILKPTVGFAVCRGRVGALIEIAAGFHPDLTGRENIYLQGAIMGMRRQEVGKRFDEIVDFAGISPFVDTPVKRFSSGMHARLGFAIAAHLDPDVLIIDEVLSVGDMAFQQRCVERMVDFRSQGAAIVFVSHNLTAMTTLCSQALVLSEGLLVFAGSPGAAVEHYVQQQASGPTRDAVVTFSHVRVTDHAGGPVTACRAGTSLRISAAVTFHESLADLTFGLVVHQAASGIYVYGVNSGSLNVPPQSLRSGETLHIAFDFEAHLTRGLYLIELHVVTASTMTLHARSYPAAVVRVEEDISARGVANLDARYRSRLVQAVGA